MRGVRCALLLLAAAPFPGSAAGQNPTDARELQALLDRATTLPPEFRADILLRLASSATPSAAIASAATGLSDVTVTTGSETITAAGLFAVGPGIQPVPSGTLKISPAAGQLGQRLHNVAITGIGTHFAPGLSRVTFSHREVSAVDVTVSDSTHLTATVIVSDPVDRWQRERIAEAFSAAADAQFPYRMRGEPTTDARASRMYWPNDLETLTLQSRAVDQMLLLDPQRARVMFEEIPSPHVPALSCQEISSPQLSPYYEAADRVFRKGFTPKQRQEGEDLRFLSALILRIESPPEVTPLVKLIFTVPLTAEQRRQMVATFAGALDRINSTPRLFGDASWRLVPVSAPPQLPPGIKPLPPMLESPSPGELPRDVVATASVLLPALRSYIVRHVSGPQCSEYNRPGELPETVGDFNYLVSKLDPDATIYKPISSEEAAPLKDNGTYEPHMWWQSTQSRQVLSAMQWLNHGNRDLPDDQRFWTLEERQTSTWAEHCMDTLKLIDDWKPADSESADDWFGMVAAAYQLVARLVPPGEMRNGAMTRYLDFVHQHYADVESRNLWFTAWKDLLRSKDPWVLDRLAQSPNPVIAVYARVARIASAP